MVRESIKFELIALLLVCCTNKARCTGPHPPLVTTHHHPKPNKDVKLTKDVQVLHDKQHLREDMGKLAVNTNFEEMSDTELEFHYFQIHDVDHNNHLDGLEIYHAIIHSMIPMGENEPLSEVSQEMEDNIAGMVDNLLRDADTNSDGYISYPEYINDRQSVNRKSKK